MQTIGVYKGTVRGDSAEMLMGNAVVCSYGARVLLLVHGGVGRNKADVGSFLRTERRTEGDGVNIRVGNYLFIRGVI